MVRGVAFEVNEEAFKGAKCTVCGKKVEGFILGSVDKRYYGNKGFFCHTCLNQHVELLGLMQAVLPE